MLPDDKSFISIRAALIASPRGWAYLTVDIQILKYLSLPALFCQRRQRIPDECVLKEETLNQQFVL